MQPCSYFCKSRLVFHDQILMIKSSNWRGQLLGCSWIKTRSKILTLTEKFTALVNSSHKSSVIGKPGWKRSMAFGMSPVQVTHSGSVLLSVEKIVLKVFNNLVSFEQVLQYCLIGYDIEQPWTRLIEWGGSKSRAIEGQLFVNDFIRISLSAIRAKA